jgi:DNA-nicking Smr family endonuclease
MATKKKTKKRPAKSKKTISNKATPRKKLGKKKAAPKKATAKSKSAGKKATGAKKVVAARSRTPAKRQGRSAPAFSRERAGSQSGELSGDLQGLSNRERADSESVDELLGEGNAFEADAVSGVEAADDADEQEVHTHEVPEDDVPGEYLDEE